MKQSTIDFDQKIAVPDNVLFRELDGEAVILNLDDESYYGLDDVGTRMWIVVELSKTIGDAHAQLLTEYDVDAERLKADMIDLVQELCDRGLIEVENV